MEKITHEQFKQQTESIPDNELLQMAHKELSELCKNGGRSLLIPILYLVRCLDDLRYFHS